MPTEDPEQLQLALGDTETFDHYTVAILKGQIHSEELIRSHRAHSVEDALRFIEGLRDTYHQRAEVTWQTEEVNAKGVMYGLAPGGEVYCIRVTPPLTVELV